MLFFFVLGFLVVNAHESGVDQHEPSSYNTVHCKFEDSGDVDHAVHVPKLRTMDCNVRENLFFKFKLRREHVYANTQDVAHRSYMGQVDISILEDGKLHEIDHSDHASVTFLRHTEAHVFSATVVGGSETYHFDPAYRYGGPTGETWMHQTTESELKDKETGKWQLPSMAQLERRRAEQGTLHKFTDCWPGQEAGLQKEVTTGFLIDDGFFEVVVNAEGCSDKKLKGQKDCVKDYLTNLVGRTNIAYRRQMDIQLKVMEVLFGEDNIPGFDFNSKPSAHGQDCLDLSPRERGAKLRQWRETHKKESWGLWHLMTDCHPPPGTLGASPVAALCDIQGASWCTYREEPLKMFHLFAHEVGHMLGGHHSEKHNGGIMSYRTSDPKFDGLMQFVPQRRNEICKGLTDSMATNNQFLVADCWRPITRGEEHYRWIHDGEKATCSPNCGSFTWKVQTPVCKRYSADPSVPAVTVSDEFCGGVGKQTPELERLHGKREVFWNTCNPNTLLPCTAQKSGREFCGNGKTHAGEFCETTPNRNPILDSNGNSCCLGCEAWNREDSSCLKADPYIDAGFTTLTADRSMGEKWLFQGSYFAVYDDWESNFPKPGYPQPLYKLFGGITAHPDQHKDAWKTSIDAAMALPNNEVYLFKGVYVLKADISSNQVLAGYPKTIKEEFNLQNFMLFQKCSGNDEPGQEGNGVQAAVGMETEGFLLCQGVLLRFPYADINKRESERLAQFFNFGDWQSKVPETDYDSMVSAIVRNPVTEKLRVYVGRYNFVWFGNAMIDTPFENIGIHMDHEEATIEHGVAETLVKLNFDNGCKEDKAYISNYSEIKDQLAYSKQTAFSTKKTECGVSPTALRMNPNLKLQLKPQDHVTENWKISFWWKPRKNQIGSFLSFLRDRGVGPELFQIRLNTAGDGESEVNMYDDTFTVNTEALQLTEWNKIEFQFQNGIISVTVNNEMHELPTENAEDNREAVTFDDWWIGADDGTGMFGLLDELRIEVLPGEEEKAADLTAPPTSIPTSAPTTPPTSIPTSAPTTPAPTSAPTRAPTSPPTTPPRPIITKVTDMINSIKSGRAPTTAVPKTPNPNSPKFICSAFKTKATCQLGGCKFNIGKKKCQPKQNS